MYNCTGKSHRIAREVLLGSRMATKRAADESDGQPASKRQADVTVPKPDVTGRTLEGASRATGGDLDSGNCSLFVGNLCTQRVTEAHIIKLFTRFGKLTSERFFYHHAGPHMGKPRGFACVLRQPTDPRCSPPSARPPPPPLTAFFVVDVVCKTPHPLTIPCSTILPSNHHHTSCSSSRPTDRPTGRRFVDFARRADAAAAIEQLNGRSLCGRPLSVRWSTKDGGAGGEPANFMDPNNDDSAKKDGDEPAPMSVRDQMALNDRIEQTRRALSHFDSEASLGAARGGGAKRRRFADHTRPPSDCWELEET